MPAGPSFVRDAAGSAGSLPAVHLLCRDTECIGNDLPAGTVADASCRFCEKDLRDGAGNVLAQGAAPLVGGEPPATFDALMEALRDAGAEVQVLELTTVRHGDRLLYSTVTDAGEVIAAGVAEGDEAEQVEHVMDLIAHDE